MSEIENFKICFRGLLNFSTLIFLLAKYEGRSYLIGHIVYLFPRSGENQSSSQEFIYLINLYVFSIRHLFKRPYDSRSNTSYTRRRRKRHKSRLSIESSPEEEEENQLTSGEKSPKISSNRNVNNSSRRSSHKSLINAKRNLTEEFIGEEPSKSPRIKTPRISRRNLGEELALQEPSIQRTTSWVADLAKSTNEILEG